MVLFVSIELPFLFSHVTNFQWAVAELLFLLVPTQFLYHIRGSLQSRSFLIMRKFRPLYLQIFFRERQQKYRCET